MKKYLLLLMTVLLVACTNENETALNETPPSNPFEESDELIKSFIPASEMDAVEVVKRYTNSEGLEKLGDGGYSAILLEDAAAIQYLFTEKFVDRQYEIYRSDLIYEETGLVIYYYRGLGKSEKFMNSGIYGTAKDENGDWFAGINYGLGLTHVAFEPYTGSKSLRVGDMRDLMQSYPEAFERIVSYEETAELYQKASDETKSLAADYRE